MLSSHSQLCKKRKLSVGVMFYLVPFYIYTATTLYVLYPGMTILVMCRNQPRSPVSTDHNNNVDNNHHHVNNNNNNNDHNNYHNGDHNHADPG